MTVVAEALASEPSGGQTAPQHRFSERGAIANPLTSGGKELQTKSNILTHFLLGLGSVAAWTGTVLYTNPFVF